MKQLTYKVSFNTPAFLGNAEQQGQWRTPPFKALLRQWWRVAYAAEKKFAVRIDEMRREEGLLFGHAWLGNDTFESGGRQEKTSARKSLVRMRLDQWKMGKLKSWQGLEQGAVFHPGVQRTKVGPHAYLGYGPLDGRGSTKLSEKINAAIQADESATLSIAVPDDKALHIERALWLMDRYGTLGGRSRNGWGSFTLSPIKKDIPALEGQEPLRPWRDCLDRDWPHAIGQDDEGALIWQTAPHEDWKALMKTLAIVKIGLRTMFVFPSVPLPHPRPLPRHWLSYPITRHATSAFDQNARLPNSLRFKVRETTDGKLVGLIFHVPHLPPPAFQPERDRRTIECVWRCVHGFLDDLAASPSPRWSACACLDQNAEAQRQTRLKDWWGKADPGDKAKLKLTRTSE